MTDQRVCVLWIKKLKEHNSLINDMKLRNRIMNLLMKQVLAGKMSPPFNEPPKFQTLAQVMIPEEQAEKISDDIKLPQIMRLCPDHGAFLASQPVPKSGTFCFMAVSTRPPNH